MPRVQLPPGCLGFRAADGVRIPAEAGAGSFANVDDKYIPALRNNDYAQAGLVDAGPEKFFTKDVDGRWCKPCRRVWNRWNHECPKCGAGTVPEAEMPRDLPKGQYQP